MPRRSRKDSVALETAGRLATAIGEHPREFVALVMVTIAVFGIVTNALFLQKGPHPAPIFATRPLLPKEMTLAPRLQNTQSAPATDTANQARLQLIANIQRELTRKDSTMVRPTAFGAPKRIRRCGISFRRPA